MLTAVWHTNLYISNNGNYVTLKIPQALADEIDRLIESGTMGYRSRAEIVNDAIVIE